MEEQRRRGSGDFGDIGDIGGRIREAVSEALDSMDFGQLNQAISDTVNSALNEAKKQAEYCRDKIENASWLPKGRQGGSKGEELFFSRPAPLKIQVNWKGRVSGILFAVFGALGSGVFGFLTVAALVTMFTVLQNPFGWWLTCFSGALLALFLAMLGAGLRKNGRIGRLKRYVSELKRQGKPYCELELLGKSTAKSLSYVQKDMEKILKLEMLPGVRMDDEKTCLMLDEETYRQYRITQDAFLERQAQSLQQQKREQREKGRWKFKKGRRQKMQQGQEAQQEKNTYPNGQQGQTQQSGWMQQNGQMQQNERMQGDGGQESGQRSLAEEAIRRGGQYMEELDILRGAMEGQAVAKKLLRLDIVLERLFAVLDRHPEQYDELERFMEYYLPTTVKLVKAYQEFIQVEFPGENIRTAKLEIERTLDTINQAFENLLDDVYQDTAFDVMADATVLKSMLAREGLTGTDFEYDLEKETPDDGEN